MRATSPTPTPLAADTPAPTPTSSQSDANATGPAVAIAQMMELDWANEMQDVYQDSMEYLSPLQNWWAGANSWSQSPSSVLSGITGTYRHQKYSQA